MPINELPPSPVDGRADETENTFTLTETKNSSRMSDFSFEIRATGRNKDYDVDVHRIINVSSISGLLAKCK